MIRIIRFFFLAVLSFFSFFTHLAYCINEGPYLGLMLGRTNTHNPTKNVQTGLLFPATVSTTPTNTGFGGRIFGGYNFNPYTAIEAGFTHFAASTYKPSISTSCGDPTVRENAFDIVGKAILPICSFSIFGKAGLAVIRSSQSGSLNEDPSTGCDAEGTLTKLAPVLGVGVGYDLSQRWVADVSWTRIFKSSSIYPADLIAIGISYHWTDQYCGQFLC